MEFLVSNILTVFNTVFGALHHRSELETYVADERRRNSRPPPAETPRAASSCERGVQRGLQVPVQGCVGGGLTYIGPSRTLSWGSSHAAPTPLSRGLELLRTQRIRECDQKQRLAHIIFILFLIRLVWVSFVYCRIWTFYKNIWYISRTALRFTIFALVSAWSR